MKHKISALAHSLTPPIIWNAYLRARGRQQRFPWRQFGCMGTSANAKPLVEGRFAEIYAKYQELDPFHNPEGTRYSFYNACMFANVCRDVPGDFLCGGISWGMAARVIFEFVDVARLGKTLHLVDPFDARTSSRISVKTPEYNTDPEYVRRQYPANAPIAIHCEPIPIRPPGKLAFVFLNTGDPAADAKAIPTFYESMSPGAHLLLNNYSNNIEHYEPVLLSVGEEAIWMPSGQGLIVKSTRMQ